MGSEIEIAEEIGFEIGEDLGLGVQREQERDGRLL